MPPPPGDPPEDQQTKAHERMRVFSRQPKGGQKRAQVRSRLNLDKIGRRTARVGQHWLDLFRILATGATFRHSLDNCSAACEQREVTFRDAWRARIRQLSDSIPLYAPRPASTGRTRNSKVAGGLHRRCSRRCNTDSQICRRRGLRPRRTSYVEESPENRRSGPKSCRIGIPLRESGRTLVPSDLPENGRHSENMNVPPAHLTPLFVRSHFSSSHAGFHVPFGGVSTILVSSLVARRGVRNESRRSLPWHSQTCAAL